MYAMISTETLKELLAEAKAALAKARTGGRAAYAAKVAIRKIEKELAGRVTIAQPGEGVTR
jgi:hypothetical protein